MPQTAAQQRVEEGRRYREGRQTIATQVLRTVWAATGIAPSHSDAAAIATALAHQFPLMGDGITWRHTFAIELAALTGVEDDAA